MGLALSVRSGFGSSDASSVSVADAAEHAPDVADLSHGDFPADLHGMRRRLPDEWGAFLNKHFNSDIDLICTFFGCNERTARDWLSGRHGVNGAPLLKLLRAEPDARRFFLGGNAE